MKKICERFLSLVFFVIVVQLFGVHGHAKAAQQSFLIPQQIQKITEIRDKHFQDKDRGYGPEEFNKLSSIMNGNLPIKSKIIETKKLFREWNSFFAINTDTTEAKKEIDDMIKWLIMLEMCWDAREGRLTEKQISFLKNPELPRQVQRALTNKKITQTQKKFFLDFYQDFQNKSEVRVVYPAVNDPATEIAADVLFVINDIIGNADVSPDDESSLFMMSFWAVFDKPEAESGVIRDTESSIPGLKVTDRHVFHRRMIEFIKTCLRNAYGPKPYSEEVKERIKGNLSSITFKGLMAIHPFKIMPLMLSDSKDLSPELATEKTEFTNEVLFLMNALDINSFITEEEPVVEVGDSSSAKAAAEEEVASSDENGSGDDTETAKIEHEDTWPKKCGETILCHEPKLDAKEAADEFEKALKAQKKYIAFNARKDEVMTPEVQYYIDLYAQKGRLDDGLNPLIGGLKDQGFTNYSYAWVTAGIPITETYDTVAKAAARCVERISESTTTVIGKDGKELTLPLDTAFKMKQDFYSTYAVKRADKISSTKTDAEQTNEKVFCGAIFGRAKEDGGDLAKGGGITEAANEPEDTKIPQVLEEDQAPAAPEAKTEVPPPFFTLPEMVDAPVTH